MLPLHDRLRTAVRAALHTRFGLDARTAEVPLEVPPSRTFGDIGSPVSFELARTLRKAPRAIALELAAALGPIDGVLRVDAAPNGYLNVFLDRAAFLRARLDGSIAGPPAAAGKIIVEHTAINPNKAAHIGHLRNACLGDTLVRALRFRGHAGRGAELHRRHRRAGRRRRRRLPPSRGHGSRRRAAAGRHHPLRLLLLGSLRPRHRVVRAGPRPARRSAPRRCTRSSTATTPRRRSAPWSPTGSSAPTWSRWRAWGSTTTC